MNRSEVANQNSSPAWFCLRSQPKHEHIAAARLREEALEVFLPRIRFKKASARGPVWVTEPLFPNYLFARFNWRDSARLVRHAAGVSTIVSFGANVPTIPEEVIEELRRHVGADELHVISGKLSPDDRVQVSGGAFHGLTAVVTQVLPAKERVRVLLNFLGRQTVVEMEQDAVVKEVPPRKELL
jgi:transcriptional antiterminator RfaH